MNWIKSLFARLDEWGHQPALKRFRKPPPPPMIARMAAMPGARLQLVDSNDVVRFDMVLVRMTHHSDREQEIEFRDHTAFMEERTMHPSYPLHTIAEVKEMLKARRYSCNSCAYTTGVRADIKDHAATLGHFGWTDRERT